MRYTPLFFTLLALLPATTNYTYATAVAPSQQVANHPNDEIPLNPKVKVGKLANGFQYFIMQNTEPKERVLFYLANKIGSLQETDKQQGLAHFLEHMNFNGTEHFPKNALIDYLQKAGIRFGADLNAYTGFEETVYQLPLPTTDPELLKQGLLIMRDWAAGALLESEEIDQERGVILEEKRQRDGLSNRLQEKTFPMLTNNSRYAHRMPIGTEEVLKNFKHAEIRKFHQDWYRPELQALIVVGDIQPAEIEKAIIEQFSGLKNPRKAPKLQHYPIALTGKNQFLAFTDEEVTQTSLQILYKQEAEKTTRVKDYKTSLAKNLFIQLTNTRLAEQTRRAATPYLNAALSNSAMVSNLETNGIQIMPKPGELQASIDSVYYILAQIKQYGFTETEIERLKTSYHSSLDQSLKEYDKADSKSFMDQILAYYLKNEPAPSFDYLYPILKDAVNGVTLQDIQQYATDFDGLKNRDMILVHTKETEKVPAEQEINSWLIAAQQQQVRPYEEEQVANTLLPNLPAPGSILSESRDTTVHTQTLLLSNGVKVILKPTSFKNDEIQITSFSPGGYSLYDLADYQSAVNATSIVSNSGLGPFNSLQLSRYLTGKNASASPFINEIGEGIKGYATKEDLKTTFELIYGYFNATRLDKDLNEANLEKSKLALQNRHLQPSNVFSDSIATILYNHDPRKTAPTAAKIDQIDLERSLQIFQERFADASDFTFVIVGNFDRELIDPYIEQYLATLPNLQRKEQFRDNGAYPPAKGMAVDIRKGHDDKSTVAMAYLGAYEGYSEYNNLLIGALSSCLTVKLTERLREKEGGVYSISVSPSLAKNPRKRFGMNISFTTGPEQVEKLTSAVVEEIELIRKNGPIQEDIDKYIAEKLLSSDQQLQANGFWLSYLLSSAVDQLDPARIFNEKEAIKSITPAKVQEIAQRYLDPSSLFKFVLYPEK
ncbi:M16 family metallopeptidase [Sphingobacterium pedocola]|uniref:Peptidase M16 n=1 Tax=Sphingobacterium pedocola TaxID=2082722 RepID=A0ABR9TBJ7_9SPHI|nr:M16 family metallopeptidase [Sphingobacterium pedocola]MBE8722650.1 peptidase M16 [Sphingobacterium pedocola]